MVAPSDNSVYNNLTRLSACEERWRWSVIQAICSSVVTIYPQLIPLVVVRECEADDSILRYDCAAQRFS